MLIKDLLYALSHSCDRMVWAIKGHTILEDQADLVDKVINVVIARILGIRVGFLRIRTREFTFDGGKIHRMLNNGKIMGNIERDRVNGS